MSVGRRALTLTLCALAIGCARCGSHGATPDASIDGSVTLDSGVAVLARFPQVYEATPLQLGSRLIVGVSRHPNDLQLWLPEWLGHPIEEATLQTTPMTTVADVDSFRAWPISDRSWLITRVPQTRDRELVERLSDGGSISVASCSSAASDVRTVVVAGHVLVVASGQCDPVCGTGTAVFTAAGDGFDLAGCIAGGSRVSVSTALTDTVLETYLEARAPDGGFMDPVTMLALHYVASPGDAGWVSPLLADAGGNLTIAGPRDVLSTPIATSPTSPPPRAPVIDYVATDAGWIGTRLTAIEEVSIGVGTVAPIGDEAVFLVRTEDGGIRAGKLRSSQVYWSPTSLSAAPATAPWIFRFSALICVYWRDGNGQLLQECLPNW